MFLVTWSQEYFVSTSELSCGTDRVHEDLAEIRQLLGHRPLIGKLADEDQRIYVFEARVILDLLRLRVYYTVDFAAREVHLLEVEAVNEPT